MRTALAAAVVAISLTAACAQDRPRAAPLPPDEATELLHQRIWLDKEPRRPGDRFHLLAFAAEDYGVSQERTIWKGAFENFIYEADGATLAFRLPGSRKVVKTGFRIEPAKRGEADLKLVLDTSPLGPTTYYGYQLGEGGADAAGAEAWVKAKFGAIAD